MERKIPVFTFGETAYRLGAKLKQEAYPSVELTCFMHARYAVPEGGIVCPTDKFLCEQLLIHFKRIKRLQNLSLRSLWRKWILKKKTVAPLVLIAGLGGAFASSAVVQALRMAREFGFDPIISVVQLPFRFEGEKCRLLAEKSLIELQKYSASIKTIDHALLSELHTKDTVSYYFNGVDEQMLEFIKEQISAIKE